MKGANLPEDPNGDCELTSDPNDYCFMAGMIVQQGHIESNQVWISYMTRNQQWLYLDSMFCAQWEATQH